MATKMTVGQMMRRLRLEAGLSQAELGTQLDFSQETISRIESGDQMATARVVVRLCHWAGAYVTHPVTGDVHLVEE